MNIKFPKVILCILDGFGIASPSESNAISQADPQFFQELITYYPTKVIQASGPAVGLPWGERGNSEVGHLNMGAGRVVMQELSRINQSITDGSFYENKAFIKACQKVKKNQSTLHLTGLIGTGAVHAYEQHLYALLDLAENLEVPNIALHVFTDGRDAPPKAALESIQKLERKIKDKNNITIATVTGRFYAMDRAKHWQQTESTFNAISKGEGERFGSASKAVSERYESGINDEMIPPSVVDVENKSIPTTVNKGDVIIFFNFRNDRMIQLVKLFTDKQPDVDFVTMTSYDPNFNVDIAFPPMEIKDSLGEVVNSSGFKQFHAAETEKFAHITFFFNGHRHEEWPGEERLIIQSPSKNTKNYEDVPEMSAKPLTEGLIKRIKEGKDKLMVVNYANGDMLGHTGNITSARKAVQVLDECLKSLAEAASATHSLLIITADHGNCEQMIDNTTGNIHKEHTANPVPIVFYADELKFDTRSNLNLYTLAGKMPEYIIPDIAPTVLEALGLEIPEAMTGSVIEL